MSVERRRMTAADWRCDSVSRRRSRRSAVGPTVRGLIDGRLALRQGSAPRGPRHVRGDRWPRNLDIPGSRPSRDHAHDQRCSNWAATHNARAGVPDQGGNGHRGGEFRSTTGARMVPEPASRPTRRRRKGRAGLRSTCRGTERHGAPDDLGAMPGDLPRWNDIRKTGGPSNHWRVPTAPRHRLTILPAATTTPARAAERPWDMAPSAVGCRSSAQADPRPPCIAYRNTIHSAGDRQLPA